MSRNPRFRKKRSKSKLRLPFQQDAEVVVDGLGGQGDGLASFEGIKLFIPGALPGETVLVSPRAKKGDGVFCALLDVLETSGERAEPPCPHFGACGGCSLQHLNDNTSRHWKKTRIVDTLEKRGFSGLAVDDVQSAPVGTRRRADLRLRGKKGGARLGFNSRASHDMAEIENCLLLSSALQEAFPPLRKALATVLKGGLEGNILLTETSSGIDGVLTCDLNIDLEMREALAALAENTDMARLSWRAEADDIPETLALRRQPIIKFGDVSLNFPPGGFLQPSLEGEHLLRDAVLGGMGEASRVLDLFAGLGTFSFPLAKKAIVHAVEGSDVLTDALHRSAGRAGLGGRVTAECRDLARSPLSGRDLKPYDGCVFDPPRAGAKEQVEALVDAENLKTIVAVSCNPATFARDVRILVDGGFDLERVIPVDQFPYTSHLEVVGVLTRKKGS